MKENDLEALIDAVNDKTATERLFLRLLADDVYETRYWEVVPTGKSYNESGFELYCVFSEGKCVAVILDMGENDIHGYTKVAYRGKGVMNAALTKVVFPYWYGQGRVTQRTQFRTEQAWRSLKLMGFTLEENTGPSQGIASISLDQFDGNINFEPVKMCDLSEKRGVAIKKRYEDAFRLIATVQSEVGEHCECAVAQEVNDKIDIVKQFMLEVEPDYVAEDEIELIKRLGFVYDERNKVYRKLKPTENGSCISDERGEGNEVWLKSALKRLRCAAGCLKIINDEIYVCHLNKRIYNFSWTLGAIVRQIDCVDTIVENALDDCWRGKP